VPEYIIKGATAYRVFSDHLGSPRVIVDASTGVVVQRMDFQPFGETIQDSNPGWQPFGFAGGLYDSGTTLVHYGARDFDASVARWLAKDPDLFRAGQQNLYQYAFAEPLSWRDSNGHFAFGIGAVTGGIVGALSGFTGSAIAGGSNGANIRAAIVGGVFGALVGALDPTCGLASSASLIANSGLGPVAGLEGNLSVSLLAVEAFSAWITDPP
jgi:RHS repeat-associated protein